MRAEQDQRLTSLSQLPRLCRQASVPHVSVCAPECTQCLQRKGSMYVCANTDQISFLIGSVVFVQEMRHLLSKAPARFALTPTWQATLSGKPHSMTGFSRPYALRFLYCPRKGVGTTLGPLLLFYLEQPESANKFRINCL